MTRQITRRNYEEVSRLYISVNHTLAKLNSHGWIHWATDIKQSICLSSFLAFCRFALFPHSILSLVFPRNPSISSPCPSLLLAVFPLFFASLFPSPLFTLFSLFTPFHSVPWGFFSLFAFLLTFTLPVILHLFILVYLFCFRLSVGTESSEVEEERQRNAQASWVQRMFTSMVGETALFNTREGRAGKVHNFMLGLNLNSSMPCSTRHPLMPQLSVEDEVDAVTGVQTHLPYPLCDMERMNAHCSTLAVLFL